MGTCNRDFDENKSIFFNESWEIVKKNIKKKINSEPVYNAYNLIMEKSIQTFPIIKYQKKVFNLFVFQ